MYIKLPSSVAVPPGMIARLRKSLYGIKQAPRLFSQKFLGSLARMGFVLIPGTACVFMLKKLGKVIALVGVFVDDCILAASHAFAKTFVATLRKEYGMTSEGTPNFVLGIAVKYNKAATKLFLSLRNYTQELIDEFKMTD